MAHHDAPLFPGGSDPLDEWIARALPERPLQPEDGRTSTDPQLIQELQQFYQAEAQTVDRRIERVWQRLEQRSAPRRSQPEGMSPGAVPILPEEERTYHFMRTPLSRLHVPPPWSTRLGALVAVALLVVLVGGLVAGLILVRHGGKGTQTTQAATATSTPLPTPTPTASSDNGSLMITSVAMKDTTTGWATAYHNPIIPDEVTQILHTSDGGLHWKIVTPKSSALGAQSNGTPVRPQGSGAYVRTEDFLSGSVAWVLQLPNHFFKTTDGGQTWQPEAAPGDAIIQFTFLDAQHGWVIADVGRAVVVFRTSDGGATWVRLQASGSAFPPQTAFWGVRFLNLTTGWAVFLNEPLGSSAVVYKTVDGGATWHLQRLALPRGAKAPVSVEPPQFFNATDGLIEVGFDGGIGGQLRPYVADRPGSGSGPEGLYVTHDGGATWQGPILMNGVEFPDFIDVLHGWALNSTVSSILTTSDSGRHWTALSASPTSSGIEQLNFVSSQIGWAFSGYNGFLLFKTTDGGQTWTQLEVGIST